MRCMEVNWDKTSVKDGFLEYVFTGGEVPVLKKASLQTGNSARGKEGAPQLYL